MENGNGITKADLIEALAAQKREITSEIKNQVAEQINALRAEAAATKKELIDLITETKNESFEMARQIETNLLTEFHRYGKGQQVRLHSLESGEGDLKMRLAVIEDRLMALEARRPPTV